jgi:hypothetical protein
LDVGATRLYIDDTLPPRSFGDIRAAQVVLTLKTPYRDGTTHIVMSPLEFIQRLAALVPGPRLHPIRFHGVLAPEARPREGLVGAPRTQRQATSRHHPERAGQRQYPSADHAEVPLPRRLAP